MDVHPLGQPSEGLGHRVEGFGQQWRVVVVGWGCQSPERDAFCIHHSFERLRPCLPRSTGLLPAFCPPHGALVMVQQEVSGITRVCAYDRAGMGWSEMGPDPRDAKQITGELHTLLKGAGIKGPYVLVGHSFGGLYMQTYAARYPDEVAGVVLVDSSTDPDQFSQRPEARESYEPQKQSFAVVPLLVRLGVSLPARLGVVRLLSKF